MWRKSTRTDRVVRKLVSLVSIGCSYRTACSWAKVPRSTFSDWMKNDDFRIIMEDAKEDWLITLHKKKKQHITKRNWNRVALEKELKAREPKVYNDKVKIEHSWGVNNVWLSDDELDGIQELLKKNWYE